MHNKSSHTILPKNIQTPEKWHPLWKIAAPYQFELLAPVCCRFKRLIQHFEIWPNLVIVASLLRRNTLPKKDVMSEQSMDITVFIYMSAVWHISTRWDLLFWHISTHWDLSCSRFILVEWEISIRWNVPKWEISTGWDMPNCWHIYKYRNVHRLYCP